MPELIPINASSLPIDNTFSEGDIIFAKGDVLYRVLMAVVASKLWVQNGFAIKSHTHDVEDINGFDSGVFVRKTGNVDEEVTGIKTFASNVYAPAYYESSDKRLKTNIEHISENFKKFELKKDLGKIRYGVIAQELEVTNPELVNTDENGMKSVNYTDLLCLRLAQQENRISRLEDIIEKSFK